LPVHKFAKILFFDYIRAAQILAPAAMIASLKKPKNKAHRPFAKLRAIFRMTVVFCLVYNAGTPFQTEAQPASAQVRTAYSALSAGIGTLWLTQEQNIFKKHGLDSSLIYIRGGTTAVQALLAGEIQFGHLSPAPMMAAWAQGADFAWIGTTTHQMVFTLFGDASVSKGADLKGKKIGITRLGSASDLAVRTVLEQFGLTTKDVSLLSLGGIPEILAAMRAGAINAGILSPPTSTAARDFGYRAILHIPDLGREFTFSGIAVKRSFLQSQSDVARAYMAALTEGAKVYKEDGRAALRVLRKYLRAEDRILESGYKEYDKAISSPPYPGIKGLEAVRESLVDSTPQLKQIDLRKFIDDRFVKSN
jgi:NitT/TauT family transport system substrate-binding protein